MTDGADNLSRYLRALAALRNSGTRENKRLPAGKDAAEIPARSGASGRIATGTGSGTFGAQLVETAYADRTFHDTVNMTSTDGLFTLKVKPIKSIKFADTSGNAVVFQYKAPE